MNIQTEPIGGIPRPIQLLEAINACGDGTDPPLDGLYDEQRKYHNFWTYSVHALRNTTPDGFKIPFAAGHTRRMLAVDALGIH